MAEDKNKPNEVDALKKQLETVTKERDAALEKLAEAKPTPKKPVSRQSPSERFMGLNKGKKVKVEFAKSPTGLLNLGYAVGETAEVTESQRDFLIDLGLVSADKK